MVVKHKTLEFQTKGFRPTFYEIREEVKSVVAESGVQNGMVLVQSPHTTCSVFFEEYVHDKDICGNEFLQVDLINGLNKMFPKQLTDSQEYRYPGPLHLAFGEEVEPGCSNNGDLVNGDAHLKASLLGSSCTFSIMDGKVMTGTYGYIYFVDFDGNRPRKRKCHITVMGE